MKPQILTLDQEIFLLNLIFYQYDEISKPNLSTITQKKYNLKEYVHEMKPQGTKFQEHDRNFKGINLQ